MKIAHFISFLGILPPTAARGEAAVATQRRSHCVDLPCLQIMQDVKGFRGKSDLPRVHREPGTEGHPARG